MHRVAAWVHRVAGGEVRSTRTTKLIAGAS